MKRKMARAIWEKGTQEIGEKGTQEIGYKTS